MKTAMKKLFSFMLVAVLLVGVMPFQAFAAEYDVHLIITAPGLNTIDKTGKAGTQAASAWVDYEFTEADGWWKNSGIANWRDTYKISAVVVDNTEVGINSNIEFEGGSHTVAIALDYLPNNDDDGDTGNPGGVGNMELEPNEGPAIPDTPAVPGGDDDDDQPSGGQQNAVVTVNFVIANNVAETATHNSAASIQFLIDTYCTVDNGGNVKVSAARIDNMNYDKNQLDHIAQPGDVVHVYLYAETAPEDPIPACEKCGVAPCICDNCRECGAPADEEHREDCSKHPNYNRREMTKITLNYNYKGAGRNGSFEAKKGDLLSDVVASIPAPTRDGHLFSHWTMDADGYDLINDERVTNGVTIYAQWDDDLAVGGKLTIKVNLNYDRKMGESLTNIKRGTRMGDVLDYVTEPTRWNYKFMGWYWDRHCEDAVEDSDKVYKNDEIFAKWERRRNTNEIMLKIYLNDNSKSVAQIVDLYDYSKDGRITKDEVDSIVKKHYTAKSSTDDMDIDGLFTTSTWNNGKYSMRNAESSIRVDRDDETIVYVMVRDAKVRTSSSGSSYTADSTNPKTGDMIFTPVIVLGASVSALAVLFYLNKKRAF